MKLKEYITELGVDKAAALFEVKPRTVESWLYAERAPRKKTAALIVQRTPLTFDDIYGYQR